MANGMSEISKNFKNFIASRPARCRPSLHKRPLSFTPCPQRARSSTCPNSHRQCVFAARFSWRRAYQRARYPAPPQIPSARYHATARCPAGGAIHERYVGSS